MSVVHAMSVDVEDWFQVLNMAHLIDRKDWDGFELRCGDSTRRLLDLFAKRDAKATFFCLGWIAERLPDLIQEIHAAGHEIGSHGYDHQLLPDLGQLGFREDLERTATILQGITGERPTAFRACTWSIGKKTPWAMAELLRSGITLDSSIQPVRHPDYGVPGAPTTPYLVRTDDGELLEFPPLTWDVLGKHVPVGGGGYLRLLPLGFMRRGLAQKERLGVPGCIYLHPWEVDPEQPRQPLGGLRGFRHYVNLSRTHAKLDRLLRDYKFASLTTALASRAESGEQMPNDQVPNDQMPNDQGPDDQGRWVSWRTKLPAFCASELLG